MRTIRQLRAWDNQNKQWVYSGRTPSMMRGFWKWVMYDSKTIVNEETGLLDKNGVEIYEGDIIDNPPERDVRFLVKFGWNTDKDAWGWNYESLRTGENYSMDDPKTFEVIGNVHENPELIKQVRRR